MQFDYIHASHWLEHVLDLESTILSLRDLSSQEGLIFIEVPNTEHDYWSSTWLDIPHIHFFTMSSLKNVFGRFSFRCLDVGEFGITWAEQNQGVQLTGGDYGPRKKGWWLRALFEKE